MTLKKQDINQFTGTSEWYRHPLFRKFIYTDGIKHVAEKGGAYWLIDDIFSWQMCEAVNKEPFQFWMLQVKENRGYLKATDGNNKTIAEQVYTFTDFPLDEITLYFTNNVLLLPSEY